MSAITRTPNQFTPINPKRAIQGFLFVEEKRALDQATAQFLQSSSITQRYNLLEKICQSLTPSYFVLDESSAHAMAQCLLISYESIKNKHNDLPTIKLICKGIFKLIFNTNCNTEDVTTLTHIFENLIFQKEYHHAFFRISSSAKDLCLEWGALIVNPTELNLYSSSKRKLFECKKSWAEKVIINLNALCRHHPAINEHKLSDRVWRLYEQLINSERCSLDDDFLLELLEKNSFWRVFPNLTKTMRNHFLSKMNHLLNKLIHKKQGIQQSDLKKHLDILRKCLPHIAPSSSEAIINITCGFLRLATGKVQSENHLKPTEHLLLQPELLQTGIDIAIKSIKKSNKPELLNQVIKLLKDICPPSLLIKLIEQFIKEFPKEKSLKAELSFQVFIDRLIQKKSSSTHEKYLNKSTQRMISKYQKSNLHEQYLLAAELSPYLNSLLNHLSPTSILNVYDNSSRRLKLLTMLEKCKEDRPPKSRLSQLINQAILKFKENSTDHIKTRLLNTENIVEFSASLSKISESDIFIPPSRIRKIITKQTLQLANVKKKINNLYQRMQNISSSPTKSFSDYPHFEKEQKKLNKELQKVETNLSSLKKQLAHSQLISCLDYKPIQNSLELFRLNRDLIRLLISSPAFNLVASLPTKSDSMIKQLSLIKHKIHTYSILNSYGISFTEESKLIKKQIKQMINSMVRHLKFTQTIKQYLETILRSSSENLFLDYYQFQINSESE